MSLFEVRRYNKNLNLTKLFYNSDDSIEHRFCFLYD